jgi:hypothetical protein
MGIFIDKGFESFRRIVKSGFVDKSMLIEFTNRFVGTEKCYICISRPRRFGKSVAAKMLYAYYDRKSVEARPLFENLEIARQPDFEKHLNKYPVIYLDFNTFAEIKPKEVVTYFQKRVIADLKGSYPFLKEENILSEALREIHNATSDKFVLIIDEWDMLVRDVDTDVQTEYVNFLRSMFKSNTGDDIFELVYMTGILPIIKYKTQSALNNFKEYSVLDPKNTAKFYGFTLDEVKALCKKFKLNLSRMKHAYDGYIIGDEKSMFNPNSVANSVIDRSYGSYWGRTALYTTIEYYINYDTENLKPLVTKMLNGESVSVNITKFRNDMKNVKDYNDVLTLLAHLGYLSYDPKTKTVRIPNTEVAQEFENSLSDCDWGYLSMALAKSRLLLQATIEKDRRYIADAIEAYHREATSFLKFNDENSLACAIKLAYYSAIEDYEIFREFPSGKGFADMVFVPVTGSVFPAIVVELKWDKSAKGAIAQIKNKEYPKKLQRFSREIILLGINYDKDAKDIKYDIQIEGIRREKSIAIK